MINWNNPITRNLVFDMPFFEGGGTSVKDGVSKTSGSFSGSGGPTWNKRFLGPVVTFTDSTDIINYTDGSNSPQTGPTKFSVEALIYPTGINAANDSRVIHKGAASKFFYLGATLNGTNKLQFGQEYNTQEMNIQSTTITLSTWIHVIVTCVSATANGTGVTFYVNGIKNASTINTTGTGTAPTDTNELFIGNRGSAYGSTKGWVGDIAYVRLWNRILLPFEAKSLFSNPWQIYNKAVMLQSLNSVAAAVVTNKNWKTLLGAGNI